MGLWIKGGAGILTLFLYGPYFIGGFCNRKKQNYHLRNFSAFFPLPTSVCVLPSANKKRLLTQGVCTGL